MSYGLNVEMHKQVSVLPFYHLFLYSVGDLNFERLSNIESLISPDYSTVSSPRYCNLCFNNHTLISSLCFVHQPYSEFALIKYSPLYVGETTPLF